MMSPMKTVIGEVPILLVRPTGSAPAPLILLSHGFSRSKEDWLEQLVQLAAKGYFAVAMDSRFHGERPGPGFSALLPEGKPDLPSMLRSMLKTAEDLSLLIDHLCRDEAIDPDRIAVAGASTGGFVSFAALVNDPRIKVATSIIASPLWGDIPELDATARADLIDEFPALRESNRRESIPPRALLMQIGSEDAQCDGAQIERFCEGLRELYGDEPERVRLIVHPGVGHELTAEMWANAVAWLEKYL